MAKPFAIVSVPRTGSSVLTAALRSHPDIFCQGEIFHPDADEHIFGEARCKVDLSLRTRNPIVFVSDILSFSEGRRWIGFKIFFGHNNDALAFILKNPAIKKIVLKRTNLLATYSSLELAKRTSVWNTRYGGNSGPPRLRFDRRAFQRYCQGIEDVYRYYETTLAESEQRYLTLEYDKHILNWDPTPVFRFLGAAQNTPVTTELKKVNSFDIVSRFENQADLLKFLRESGHEHWATES